MFEALGSIPSKMIEKERGAEEREGKRRERKDRERKGDTGIVGKGVRSIRERRGRGGEDNNNKKKTLRSCSCIDFLKFLRPKSLSSTPETVRLAGYDQTMIAYLFSLATV